MDNKFQAPTAPPHRKTIEFQSNIKTFCVFLMGIMVSFLFGHYLVAPALNALSKFRFIYGFMLGASVFFLLYLAVRHYLVIGINKDTKADTLDKVPKTVREITDFGVKTPLDFCIAMYYFFLYDVKPVYSIYSESMAEIDDEEAWKGAIHLFEAMFNRKPDGYKEGEKNSWLVYADHEVRRLLNVKEGEPLAGEDLLNALSPELKEHFHVAVEDSTIIINDVSVEGAEDSEENGDDGP